MTVNTASVARRIRGRSGISISDADSRCFSTGIGDRHLSNIEPLSAGAQPTTLVLRIFGSLG